MSVADLDMFYGIVARLRAKNPKQGSRLGELEGAWLPKRGVYFFCEEGEQRRNHPDVKRVVRVGTHAVSAGSKSTLWQRLRAHRGSLAGGGNHRGSIFRRHVGAALLRRDGRMPAALAEWGVGSNASREVRAGEAEHERQVSEYLGAMQVLWVNVPDEPQKHSMRAYIERNAIGLLSRTVNAAVDGASSDWLGHQSPERSIRDSGLWNVNYVDCPYESEFLSCLDDLVEVHVA